MFAVTMPGRSYRGPLQDLSETERDLASRLRTHVTSLAGDIGERNVWRAGSLARAADYIEGTFRAAGYEARRRAYAITKAELEKRLARSVRALFLGIDGGALAGDEIALWNIEAEAPGAGSTDQVVVVGAHYDTVPSSPGANDNGSGVAAVLELARMLRQERPPRTVRFVAFTNEEPPFFHTDLMGSRVYAREARARNEAISAMFSLETIGYYSERPGSQRYPFPLGLFYPRAGNFVGFVGNFALRALVRKSIAAFRRHARFPSEGLAAPAWLPGVDWSDQSSFWKQGYPAIMVTDTAPYRYPHYHHKTYTPDKIDYGSLARVVAGLDHVIRSAAGAEDR